MGKNNPDTATAVQAGTDEGGMRTGEKPQVEASGKHFTQYISDAAEGQKQPGCQGSWILF